MLLLGRVQLLGPPGGLCRASMHLMAGKCILASGGLKNEKRAGMLGPSQRKKGDPHENEYCTVPADGRAGNRAGRLHLPQRDGEEDLAKESPLRPSRPADHRRRRRPPPLRSEVAADAGPHHPRHPGPDRRPRGPAQAQESGRHDAEGQGDLLLRPEHRVVYPLSRTI